MSAAEAVNRDRPARDELERWYRLLLRAYPSTYRRAHGDEILTTLMDAAAPGQRKPGRADVTDLVRGALRQRFRLPVGVVPIVAAILASLIVAAFGAASGSWLAWQTAANLPSGAAAGRIGATVTGTSLTASTIDRHEGPAGISRAINLDYEPRISGWTLEEAQARLRADGWTPGRVQSSDQPTWGPDGKPLDAVYQVFEATRSGHLLRGYASTVTTPGYAGTSILIRISPVEPSWAPVAVAVGWLVGALTGWLVTAWASYRLRRRTLPRRLAALILCLTAVGLAAQPTAGLYGILVKTTFTHIDIYGIFPPYQWLVTGPAAWLIAATLVAGVGILLLAGTGSSQSTTRITSTV